MGRPDQYSHSKQRAGPAVWFILCGRVTFVVKKLTLKGDDVSLAPLLLAE
jgi:hypothetical protein